MKPNYRESLLDLMEELDTLSEILTDLGMDRDDPIFLGLSSKVDDLIEKYNLVVIETTGGTDDDYLNETTDGC
jgi:hypothetical protein